MIILGTLLFDYPAACGDLAYGVPGLRQWFFNRLLASIWLLRRVLLPLLCDGVWRLIEQVFRWWHDLIVAAIRTLGHVRLGSSIVCADTVTDNGLLLSRTGEAELRE